MSKYVIEVGVKHQEVTFLGRLYHLPESHALYNLCVVKIVNIHMARPSILIHDDNGHVISADIVEFKDFYYRESLEFCHHTPMEVWFEDKEEIPMQVYYSSKKVKA